jgi:hypothetical protein
MIAPSPNFCERPPEMTRQEFQTLRDLQGKRIAADIIFKPASYGSSNLVFENVVVENEPGWDIIVNGTFKPGIPTITYNFYVRSEGPICRVCVNGTHHSPGGRTHKHELRHEADTRQNLPTVIARPDLEGLSPREIWVKLMADANIQHTGTFFDP